MIIMFMKIALIMMMIVMIIRNRSRQSYGGGYGQSPGLVRAQSQANMQVSKKTSFINVLLTNRFFY